MRYCSFSLDGTLRFGFELTSDRVCDLRESGRELHSKGMLQTYDPELFESATLKEWLAHGREALEIADRIKELVQEYGPNQTGVYLRRQTRLLAPIQNPGKVIAIGLNYMDHAKEQKKPLPKNPLIFAKFPSSIIGPDDPIKIPPVSRQVDPEAELCVVMLEGGRWFTRESARRAAGFMVGNDVSARDLQYSDKQWVRGKSCDTFAPCGPFLVTDDDVGDPHDLSIELKINDRIQQSSNTSNLIFSCFQLIQYVSESITLEIGDIIFTGTPSGVGVFREPQVFLQPGDVVEVRIENLGTLRNPVVAG
jgi:acylpyruvate hydrolase